MVGRFPCPGGKELSGPLSVRAGVVVSRGHPMRVTGWAELLEAVPQPMGKPKSVDWGTRAHALRLWGLSSASCILMD